jgi:ariadne-1
MCQQVHAQVQFLRRAVEILSECRMTLRWSYAHAFYLERNNQTEIFEVNQADLEQAVEALSGLLGALLCHSASSRPLKPA